MLMVFCVSIDANILFGIFGIQRKRANLNTKNVDSVALVNQLKRKRKEKEEKIKR